MVLYDIIVSQNVGKRRRPCQIIGHSVVIGRRRAVNKHEFRIRHFVQVYRSAMLFCGMRDWTVDTGAEHRLSQWVRSVAALQRGRHRAKFVADNSRVHSLAISRGPGSHWSNMRSRPRSPHAWIKLLTAMRLRRCRSKFRRILHHWFAGARGLTSARRRSSAITTSATMRPPSMPKWPSQAAGAV